MISTLDKALKDFGIPNENQLILKSDNNTQMTSNVFAEHVNNFDEDQLFHELIPPATPNKNAQIEAFNSILETAFIQPRYFMTYGQAYSETAGFMSFYNFFRIHGSLKYPPPCKFMRAINAVGHSKFGK